MDMNCYFASCEQHLVPKLRGKPVAVTPVIADGGCCIATSYAARSCGVKTGCSVGEARKLCPEIEIVKSRPDEYIKIHHQLLDLVENCMHIESVCSIDEWCCPLTGKWREPDEAVALAKKIKAKLADFSPVLRCSIGLAPNHYLAKVGSDMRKPDGLMLLRDEDLPQALYEMKNLRDLCGIGKHMEQRLNYYGIGTVKQLCELSREHMRIIWGGVFGERFYMKLHGMEVPETETNRSQIGHSRVLPPELRNKDSVRACSFRLMQRAAVRLRAEEYVSGRMFFQLNLLNEPPWEDSISMPPSRDTPGFVDVLKKLWNRCPRTCNKPIYCAVIFCELEPVRDSTMSLFSNDEHKDDALAAAIDSLARKYGQKSLYFGGAMGAIEDGPPRISFTRVPDLDIES
jgi:DNA polymerase IV